MSSRQCSQFILFLALSVTDSVDQKCDFTDPQQNKTIHHHHQESVATRTVTFALIFNSRHKQRDSIKHYFLLDF